MNEWLHFLSNAGCLDFERAFMKRRLAHGEGILLHFILEPLDNMETNRYLKKKRGRHEKEEESILQMPVLA
jgi:hypothetical protein